MLKKLIDLLPAVWGLFKWAFPTTAAAITAWVAHMESAPVHLIIFYSTGVLAFCAIVVAAMHYLIRNRTVYERLRYVGTEPIFVHPNPAANSVGIMFKCKLQNMNTVRSIYVSVKRADAQLQGRVHPAPTRMEGVVIVPPFCDFAVTTAAIPEVNVGSDIRGKLELEILYGPKEGDLRYVLAYEIAPRVDIHEITEKDAKVLFTGLVSRYQHKKV